MSSRAVIPVLARHVANCYCKDVPHLAVYRPEDLFKPEAKITHGRLSDAWLAERRRHKRL
jgi:hypothetical protein